MKTPTLLPIIITTALTLVGCSVPPHSKLVKMTPWELQDCVAVGFYPEETRQDARELLISRLGLDWTLEEKGRVRRGEVAKGMTTAMVRSSWGTPHRETRQSIPGGEMLYWTWEGSAFGYSYVQFYNGRVVYATSVASTRP